MSTKIYNGRKIDLGIGEAYRALLHNKPEAVAIGEDKQNAWMVRRAVEKLDGALADGKDRPESPLFEAWSEMMDRQHEIKKTGRRDPSIDFEFELWLFPRAKSTLLIVNTECRALQEWFDALPFVKEYGYWDNTDPLDTVSAAAWRSRRLAWEEALPGAGVPSDRCLTFSMFANSFRLVPAVADVMQHVPSIEQRLNHQARARHVNEVIELMRIEALAKGEALDGLRHVWEADRIAREQTVRREKIKEMLSPLIRELTPADLAHKDMIALA